MASLPSAQTRLQDESGGVATGTDALVVITPARLSADGKPRLFGGAQALLDVHGYCQGASFAAMFIEATRLPVYCCAVPIDTIGTIGRFDATGNTGTSVVTAAPAPTGIVEETDGILEVVQGGTIGTDQILLRLSLDGGRRYKALRLGSANAITLPYVGIALAFAPGTLIAGDVVLTWHSTAPLAGAAGIAEAKTQLAAQLKQARSWILIGDLSVAGDATAIRTAVNAYETSDERYVACKASLRDRLPRAELSHVTVRMSGAPTLTFTDAGPADDYIERSVGSWIADGFAVGDRVTVLGAVNAGNNIDADDIESVITILTGARMTLDGASFLTNEAATAGCSVVGEAGLVFTNVGAAGDTIVRNRGSWLADGFRAADSCTIAGTVGNDGTDAVIDAVTASTITLTTYALADEEIGAESVTLTAGETDVECIATLDGEFESVTGKRLDLGYGRGAMACPITGWRFRRSSNWCDMILAYLRDMRTTTWWKDLGPIADRLPAGFDLLGPDGQLYEHDERVTPGALQAGFTCARTWGNGPAGSFIAQSLTREESSSVLSLTHNMHVANLCQTVCQSTTERFAGQTLVLERPDGTGARVATATSLKQLEGKVNDELERYLLSNIGGEGQRASYVRWTAAIDDDLGVADAVLHGVCELELNGTIVHIETAVRVR